MGQTKERKKARRRLKKPRKFYTNAQIFTSLSKGVNNKTGIAKPQKISRKPNITGISKRLTPQKMVQPIKVPKTISVRLNTKYTILNKYGLPKGVTPERLKTKQKQVIQSLINRGVKPSEIDNVKYNWEMLRKAALYFERSKKQETRDKWGQVISDLSINIQMLGLTSSTYEDGIKKAYLKGTASNTEEAKRYRQLYFDAKGEDDYVGSDGLTFKGGVFYDVDETDKIINKMGGGSWVAAVYKYGRDVKRLVNNTGFQMKPYADHFINGTPLGEPDAALAPVTKYKF